MHTMQTTSRKFQFSTAAVVTVSLPLTGFITCVTWSLVYDFKSATATHCGVYNFLPSVSAAIGDYTPQRFIWRFFIALHTIPRIHFVYVYYLYYSSILVRKLSAAIQINSMLNLIEIFSLFGLTFISSTDNYTIHKIFFSTFLLTSTLYMTLSLYLLSKGRATTPNAFEAKSYRYKKGLLLTTLVSICGAMYFFARHNNYCEPLMYTWFALCEYVVIVCNMCFHVTSFFDFGSNREWSLAPKFVTHFRQQLRV